MRVASYYGKGDIRLEEKPIPRVGPGELLIKMQAAAICGTDLRIYKHGHFKIDPEDRRVLSHENAGVIESIGDGVVNFFPGDRVIVAPNVGCGQCAQCKAGFNQLCPDYDAFGINRDGGFAEFMLVEADAVKGGNVLKVPENLSLEDAVLAEPLSCVYNSWKMLGTKPGDSVLIVGAGPIGALHVAMNKLAGATQIFLADISDQRLADVKKFGADDTINSEQVDLVEYINDVTDGRGVDVVIAACSHPSIQSLSLEVAAIHGRINFFGGMPKGLENVTLDTNKVHYKELIVLGTTGSSISDFQASLDLIASGKIEIEGLVTARYPLEEIHSAFEGALAGVGLKTLITYQ